MTRSDGPRRRRRGGPGSRPSSAIASTATRRARRIIGRRASTPRRATRSAPSRTTRSPPWRPSSTRTATSIAAASTGSGLAAVRHLRDVDDLPRNGRWSTSCEMAEDAAAHPPYGTYTAMSDAVWAERGWMMFSSSGTTGTPRVFRYSHIDRELWAWANARALHAMDFRKGDTVFMITGYGPHVWAWGVQYALAKMGLPTLARRRHGRQGARQYRDPLSSRPSCCARPPTRCISAAPCRRWAPIRARQRCARSSSPASPA